MSEYYFKITTTKNDKNFTHYCVPDRHLKLLKALKENGHTIVKNRRVKNHNLIFEEPKINHLMKAQDSPKLYVPVFDGTHNLVSHHNNDY